MRYLSAMILVLVLAACGEEDVSRAQSARPEMVMVAVSQHGSVFLSTEESSVGMEELPYEIKQLLAGGGRYTFVIQPEVNDSPHIMIIEQALSDAGVENNRIVVARSAPYQFAPADALKRTADLRVGQPIRSPKYEREYEPWKFDFYRVGYGYRRGDWR